MESEEELNHPEFFAHFLWYPGNTVKWWKEEDEFCFGGEIYPTRFSKMEG